MNWPHQKLFIDKICRKVSPPNLYQQFFCKNLCFPDGFVRLDMCWSICRAAKLFFERFFSVAKFMLFMFIVPFKSFGSLVVRPLSLPNCLKLWKKLVFNQVLSLVVRPIAEQTVSGKHEDEKNRIKRWKNNETSGRTWNKRLRLKTEMEKGLN